MLASYLASLYSFLAVSLSTSLLDCSSLASFPSPPSTDFISFLRAFFTATPAILAEVTLNWEEDCIVWEGSHRPVPKVAQLPSLCIGLCSV